ncbi:3-hydroxyacyl-CoA dehydrogenase NAD-binding domain-containing protein [Ramlibacter sp. MAHUQ-53]|uniref:3-hydroxyacyl-CoA dehydrogenase NAD-binding domain-containing protein n=1 Tax=unclassified Ramlibacter TaxID=2617605 RepID=UPI00363A9B80
MTARYELKHDVAVIHLDNPPMNGLGLATRQGVMAGLRRALEDPAVRALVLAGDHGVFSSGADIKEFGSPKAFEEPFLGSVIAALDASPKLVVAAMQGVAMGGGLELALGCHYRLAAPGLRVALPEVKLGLIPGAGGTQALPRVIGVERALDMILDGEPVTAEALAAIPGQQLFERIASAPQFLLEEAIAFARERAARHAADGSAFPRVRNLTCPSPGEAFFQQARERAAAAGRGRPLPAPRQCVEAVERATTRAFDDGVARERAAFVGLMDTPECQALRHVFMAERAASRIPDVPAGTPRREVRAVAVVGAGTMGGGIAMNFLNVGLPVKLLEMKQEALDRGLATIRRNYEAQVKKGKLAQEACERRMALLSTTLAYEDLGEADLVIEAVFEDLGVKQQVFEALDAVMKPGAILATNTSTLDVDRIAAFTKRPQDVVGLHFFSPANVMKLLEVVRGAQTAKDVLATVMALARTIRKTAVVSGVCDGFIGNRMVEQYLRQAFFLLDEGCTPAQVDRAIESFGFAMGPFRMSDLAGNDIGWAIRKRRYVDYPGMKYSRIGDLLCEQGRFGQKTGAGWYDYQPGQREALPSEAVATLLAQHRAALGITPRAVPDEEIVQRLLFALVNEGARILEEGIAGKAGDIDVVYLTGYGFPAWRGGPMHHADSVGLARVAEAMERFARNPLDDAAFWQPAPLLARLAAEHGSFNA